MIGAMAEKSTEGKAVPAPEKGLKLLLENEASTSK